MIVRGELDAATVPSLLAAVHETLRGRPARLKIEDGPRAPRRLVTVRGMGYKLQR
ncbi:hypothetical protein [Dactylosporangium sp. CA-139066]|uniref:hypothetical protein n=1 Tax=Dactylosporangium sp. CA-139066 TaxID=3239930 RepID=UPI003D9217EB